MNAFVGILCDYWTGEPLRAATPEELDASELDGARGVINVDGRACYAYFAPSLTVAIPQRASTENPDHEVRARRRIRVPVAA